MSDRSEIVAAAPLFHIPRSREVVVDVEDDAAIELRLILKKLYRI